MNDDNEEITGTYDLSFFESNGSKEPSALEHLSDARSGLVLFLEKASHALSRADLTPDQRIHVSTIASYIEGLVSRLDRIRVPGFVQRIKTR